MGFFGSMACTYLRFVAEYTPEHYILDCQQEVPNGTESPGGDKALGDSLQKDTPKEIWRQLVIARVTVGLTQTELARRMGVSQSQISGWERPGFEAYNLNTLRRYVQALGGEYVLEVKIYRKRLSNP